jgi:hypothetical protein
VLAALIAAGVITLVALLVLLWPIRVHLRVSGRGDPSGAWALAGGTEVGPLALSSAAARGVPAAMQVHVFGKRIYRRPLRRAARRDKSASIQESYTKLARFFDPLELALFLIGEQRRVRVPELEVELEYSFEDITVTGQLMGAIFALDALLPAPLVLRQRVSWAAEDRAAVHASGTLVVRVLPVLWDTFIFCARNFSRRAFTPGPAH